MRAIRSPFIALPIWVYRSEQVSTTTLQVYLALAERSLVDRKPPKGIGWVIAASGLGKTTVYDAIATLKEIGAVIDLGDDRVFLPTDDPSATPEGFSATAESDSAQAEGFSATADDLSATAERASLIENRETTDTPLSTDVDTFRYFWDAWPTRKGKKLGKSKALAVWSRLDLDTKRQALRSAKNYADASERGWAGAMDAFRWLQGRMWEEWETPMVEDPRRPGSRRENMFLGVLRDEAN